jgi:hypothetical protein
MRLKFGNERHAADAVLAYISRASGLEKTWGPDYKGGKDYQAHPEIAEWHNCREQGYIIYLRSEDYEKQLNIAVFEHRNSDSICAVMWEQRTLNPPTIDTAEFGDVYKTKWDISHSVNYDQASLMADWIINELESFWIKYKKK